MGTVSGIVRDTQGNAAPGATVTVSYQKALVGYNGGAAVQNTRVFETDGTGLLTMADLIPGHYEISFAIPANDTTTQTVMRTGALTVLEADQTLEESLDTRWYDFTPNMLQQAQAAADTATTAAQTAADEATAAVEADLLTIKTDTGLIRDETRTLRDQTYGYKQDVASAIVYQNLASIAEQKAITMVAGCVYDTRLDTDGGAWRDRRQGTSWFNEPLNTATRGTRREFPSVAVIIAEADTVTIFDGDDPSLPMWMVFANLRASGTNGAIFSIGDVNSTSAIFARNGKLVLATSANGVCECDFISDAGYRYRSGPVTWSGSWLGVISQRNDTTVGFDRTNERQIVSDLTNSVAMTVLPTAPVDPATGLQVPTIAVATDGGLSIIQNDGTVDSNTKLCDFVDFIDENRLIFGARSWWIGFCDDWQAGAERDGYYVYGASYTSSPSSLPQIPFGGDTTTALLNGACGSGQGMALLAENFSNRSRTMLALLTSTWASGWLPGKTLGAFLASTDQTDLVGGDRWTGSPSIDDGWTDNGDGSWSLDGSQAGYMDLAEGSQEVGTYVVSFTVSGRTSGFVRAKVAGVMTATSITINGTFHQTVKNTTIASIGLEADPSFDGTVSGISVQPADADRSIKGNGLIVHGTVPRAPVAAGAELVGYGPFSATNYLEQPYNSDLDFLDTGANDFCLMWWGVRSGLSGWKPVASKSKFNAGQKWMPGIGSTGKLSANMAQEIGATVVPSGKLSHFCVLRRSGTIEVYLDGRIDGSLADTAIIAAPNQTLLVGCRHGNDGTGVMDATGWDAISLLRIGATAPSAAQIAKIYRDERRLFQPGAQCTLYGTSDAVTALAHDPVTGLLHAGTSAGRSDFEGLLRIGNTTTPVAKAIAASGGMILEG